MTGTVGASLGRSGWTLVTARAIRTPTGPAQAMIVRGESVVATGGVAELAARFPVDQRIDLSGVVLPGFNDAHLHPTMTAENLVHVDCSPEVAADAEVLTRLLREEAARPEVDWVVGSRYDQTKTTGGEVIDRWFLDRVTGAKPTLVMHVAAHWGVLNSAGLAAARLDDATPDPSGGALGRDASGVLTGVVYEQALFDLAYPSLAHGGRSLIPPSGMEARIGGLRRALERFHAAGITSGCDALCGPDDLRLLSLARERGLLTMRTGVLMAYPSLPALREAGITSGLGDDRLRIVGIKAFVDGACAGGNCWVSEAYCGTDDHGMQVTDAAALNDLVREAREAALAIAVHANGDNAIRLLLDAHEAARGVGPDHLRHRIEHCSIVDDEIVARIKRLDLAVVPFAAYARYHGDKLVSLYGHERLGRMFAHRWFIDAGVPVAGSSDYPCGPLEPLLGIASCVQRRAVDGTEIGTEQRITVDEALALYGPGAAYASGDESRKGRLQPGMLADFVEVSDDPFTVQVDSLAELEVRSTWVGGECVYAGSSS